MLNAVYDASTFFSTHKGKLKADVQNLSVTMEVHISRNERERLNIIKAGDQFLLTYGSIDCYKEFIHYFGHIRE